MARQFRRRKFCRFTADGISEIDYKDLSPAKLYRVALPVQKPGINASWQRP
jgi:small subunit ribosomal protein S18